MDSAMVALLVAAGAAALLAKSRLNYLALPELPASGTTEIASQVTVVIPARNEEQNIARVVASLSGVRIIVVDDASEDRTAARASQAGAEVITAPALKRGTLGKPNACLAGARLVTTPWILFVDADTWFEPAFLGSLLSYAREQQLLMVSAFLRQVCLSWPEKILLPYAFALYFCGVNARAVNTWRSPEALANGQCLLFRREAYEFIGGHGAVADSIIEDVALARVVKRHRMELRVVRAEQLGAVRMYDSLTAICRGFQKNSFRFLLVNPTVGLQVVLASVLLTSYVPMLVWLSLDERWTVCAAFALVPALTLSPWYRPIGHALLTPFAIYGFQVIAIWGMLTTTFGWKAVWKGRRV